MRVCELEYIPEKLRWDGVYFEQNFKVGEKLFRRCQEEELENPFKSITLTDVSHNREGLNKDLSTKEDVLFNIDKNKPFQKFELQICELEIKEIDAHKSTYYAKQIENKNTKDYIGEMILIHDPVPCMVSHCIFRITIDQTIINYENSKDTIQKLNQIRTYFKNELAKMILRKEIKQPNKNQN